MTGTRPPGAPYAPRGRVPRASPKSARLALAALVGLTAATASFGAESRRVSADTLRIFFTFDARGALPILGEGAGDSAAHLQEALRWARIAAENEKSGGLLLDCGNTFFPGVLSRFSYGSALNEILGLAGAAAKRVTRRDFLMGDEALRNLRKKSAAAFLASNAEAEDAEDGFPGSLAVRRAGRDVAVYALIDPAGADGPADLPEDLEISDPEAALRARLAAAPKDSALIICLLDESLAARHPGILAVPGVDLFAVGSSHGGPILQSALRGGGWVVHVPPFSQGFGRLELYPDGGKAYRIDSALAGPADSIPARRILGLAGKWSALYLKENGGILRAMKKPLEKDQAGAVGALLRERTGTEVACVERPLIQDAPLPAQVRNRDLDKLLVSSPDVYVLRVEGSSLKPLRRRADLACSGLDGARPLDPDEIYALALTETEAARAFPEAFDPDPEYRPRLWRESLQEAVRQGLIDHRPDDWDFSSLRKRWRLAGWLDIDASRRQVHVWNGDSLPSVPGDLGEPLSTWELSLRAPLRFYNDVQSLEFLPEADYSRIDRKVGSDFLSFRLDYSAGPRPRIRPYASGTYETYLEAVPEEGMPVRARGALGLQSALGAWTLKLGAASEKTLASRDPNPFGPFPGIFTADSVRWDHGAEFVVEGRQDIAKLFGDWWTKHMRSAELTVEVAWNNFVGASGEGGRAESRLRTDLSAGLLGNLQVTLGLRSLAAYATRGGGAFFSTEPSMSLSLQYRFKTLP